MRILHVNDYAYRMGGAETYLAALIAAQRAAGHEVALLASDSRGGGTLERVGPDEGRLEPPLRQARGTSSDSRVRRAARQLFNGSARAAARHAADAFAPDVVHVHMYLGQLSPAVLGPFARRRCALVHTAHTYKVACPKGTRMLPNGRFCEHRAGIACGRECSVAHFLQWELQRLAYPPARDRFGCVVAPSSTMAAALRIEGFPRVRTLPYGSTFPIAPRPVPEGASILYVGRLADTKGIYTLLDAFSQLLDSVPEARLTLVGAGPEEERVRALVRSRFTGVQCDVLGRRTSQEIHLLQDCHRIQCVPSIWPENSPLVVYECLARGVAMVAARTGGIPDLVRDGVEALLVAPGDASALAAALERLLVDEDLCRAMSAACARRARAFTMEGHVAALDGIYREAGQLAG